MPDLVTAQVQADGFLIAASNLAKRTGAAMRDIIREGAKQWYKAAVRYTPPRFKGEGWKARISAKEFDRPVTVLWDYARRGIWHTEKVDPGFAVTNPGDKKIVKIYRNVRIGNERRKKVWEFGEDETAANASPYKRIKYRGLFRAGWQRAAQLAGVSDGKGWQNRENTATASASGRADWNQTTPEVVLTNSVPGVDRIIEASYFENQTFRVATRAMNRITAEKWPKVLAKAQKEMEGVPF